MHYFSIFSKTFNKPCVNFLRVWTKTQIVGKFWENFEIFCWKFYRKIEFFILFYFYFFIFFENLLLKIELSEITPFFYNIFSVSGGRISPLSPWLRPCLLIFCSSHLAWSNASSNSNCAVRSAHLMQIEISSIYNRIEKAIT